MSCNKVLILDSLNDFKTSEDKVTSFDIKKIKPRVNSRHSSHALVDANYTSPSRRNPPARATSAARPPTRRCDAATPLRQVIRMNSVDPNS